MGIRQRSVSEVQKILEDYYQSGLTVTDYCSKHNLNAGTFHWWLSRERKSRQNNNTVSPFIRLNGSSTKETRQQMIIEIELPNGVRTRIRAALSFSQLSDLLSTCES